MLFVSSGCFAGSLHHGIDTRSPAAQRAFDSGLAYVYAFNFEAASREFRRAAALDPGAAMPYWGMALALGPNYNAPTPGLESEREASDDLSKARVRVSALPPSAEVDEERAYIEALTLRFTCAPRANYPALEGAYAGAMRVLSLSHPDDPDAATLYAEALMEQRGWSFWDPGGAASPGTAEILGTLEAVLHRWPDHIGANHLYIHAAEASAQPDRATASARRLADLQRSGGFSGDGHLLHMPAHIYLRTGDYAAAEASTRAAAVSDRAYTAAHPEDASYNRGYASHNLAFLVVSAEMDGDFEIAASAASRLLRESRTSGPGANGAAIAPMSVLVRFGRWKQILATPRPPHSSAATQLYWHFARATALARTGELAQALAEMPSIRAGLRSPWLDVGMPILPRPLVFDLLSHSLSARIAAARHSYSLAADQWRQAIAAEDQIGYREPPAWYPQRESLAAVYLQEGQPAEAEKVLRECLRRWPNDPRALFALAQALGVEGRAMEAKSAREQAARAWRGALPRVEDF